mgnify:CR=1 FL=1|tara:strand:- start:218 stop:697 length:480 start_codon:yes stop_codon:yes gene_type:complete
MKMYLCRPILTVAWFAILSAFGATQTTRAAEPENPMVLRAVMQQLERDMQSVTGAISREDWEGVAELAPRIASHPEPPVEEKVRILTWLGRDASKFRSFDAQTHDAAEAMGEAAARRDGKAVIVGFANVQQSCLGCHQSFRKPFTEHFYAGDAAAADTM